MQTHRRRWSNVFAVLCIALGTAAVSAVLALVDTTLLQPLPLPDAGRLVRIWSAEPQGDPRIDLSMPEMDDLRRELRGVETFSGAARSRIVARLPGGPERLRGEAVDAAYFDLIGVQPALGRLFGADEYRADSEPTLLLSHALWSSRYGSDPAVLGRTLVSDEHSFRIVGVLPRGFAGTIENDVIDYWIPQAHYLPAALRQDRRARLGWTLARLAPGTTLDALQSELDARHARWRAVHPEQYAGNGLRTEAFGENWRGPLRQNAGLLLAAVAVLLVIAVSNVSALLLARAIDRRRELALRSALGAGRARLARELMFETARLALLGGVIGALAAPWLLRVLLALSPLQLPSYLPLHMGIRGVILVVGTLMVASLTAAVLPAWLGSRIAPQSVLASEGRSSAGVGDRRLWTTLMASQLALSFALLVVGALLLRSYVGLSTVELGFRRTDVLRMAVSLAPADYGEPASLPPLYERLSDALRAQPGVEAAGLVAPTLPPWDANRPEIRHAALAPDAEGLRVGAHVIDDGLLHALDIPLLAGRAIGAGDAAAGAPVALVSAALAQRLGGTERALGSELEIVEERAGRPGGHFRIVGVVGDVAWDGLGEQDTGRYIRYGANDDARGSRHDLYLSLAQQPNAVVSIAVHTTGPPDALVEPLRRVLARVAPSSAVHWISTMQEELEGEVAPARFYLTLVAVFGIAAVLLAAVGVFALLSHALLKREREIGIRRALGATVADVARLLLGDGIRLLGYGLGAGLLLALMASRAVESRLYRIDGFDPLAYGGAATLMVLVATIAGLLPLLRALRASTTTALKSD